jgi:neurofibromin 1
MSLDEYSLAKFYTLFGISKVKSPAVMAFSGRYRNVNTGERVLPDRSLGGAGNDREKISLQSLEIIADSLLEIMEVCNVKHFFYMSTRCQSWRIKTCSYFSLC